jgi:Holliday junction resolvase
MPIKAKSAKAKGSKLEKEIVDDLKKDCKWEARKQPGSGIFSDFPHDCFAISPTGRKYIFEAKKHKNGYRTGDRQKGQADFLVIQADRSTSKVYMEWSMFKELCLEMYELHTELEKRRKK